MSKRLEDEYKKMIEGEVPDLWARIESSLPEKNVAVRTQEMQEEQPVPETVQAQEQEQPVQAQTQEQPVQMQTQEQSVQMQTQEQPVQMQTQEQPAQTGMQEQSSQTSAKKKPVIFKILPWVGGVMAAAIILMIAIPAAILSHKVGKGKENAGTTAMSQMMEEPLAAETAAADSMDYVGDAEEEVKEEGLGMGGSYDFAVAEGETKSVQGFATGKNSLMAGEEDNMQNGVEVTPGRDTVAEAVPENAQRKGESEEEEESFFVLVTDVKTAGDTTVCFFLCSLDAEDFFNDNPSLEIASRELSKDSVCEPEICGIYRADTPDGMLRLLEKVEEDR